MTNYMIYMMYIYDIYIYIHNSQNQTKTKLRFVVDLFFVSDIPFFFVMIIFTNQLGSTGVKNGSLI